MTDTRGDEALRERLEDASYPVLLDHQLSPVRAVVIVRRSVAALLPIITAECDTAYRRGRAEALTEAAEDARLLRELRRCLLQGGQNGESVRREALRLLAPHLKRECRS